MTNTEEHYAIKHTEQAAYQIDVLREIRNEINTPILLDRIAIAALQGMFASNPDEFWVGEKNMAKTCEGSYLWAKYMMEARNK
jgi:hypothetical protein